MPELQLDFFLLHEQLAIGDIGSEQCRSTTYRTHSQKLATTYPCGTINLSGQVVHSLRKSENDNIFPYAAMTASRRCHTVGNSSLKRSGSSIQAILSGESLKTS